MSTKRTPVQLEDGEYQFSPRWGGMIQQDVSALIAASFPVKPPKQWFSDPDLRTLTPLTIDNTGRVYGHIAGWKTAHIGLAGGVRPPKSRSGYAFFRTGALETAEGDLVDVGQITLAGGHAPLDATVEKAVAHYDDTKSAVMDVTCGEDRHGIWVAGALRPSIDDETIRTIRASSVSGDWRPINGRLEMVAVCAVNCPGFPIPRSLVSGGQPIALVAAGTEPIVEKILFDRASADLDEELQSVLEQMRNRIKRVENAVLFADNTVTSEEDDEVIDLSSADESEIVAEVEQILLDADEEDGENYVPSLEERVGFMEQLLVEQLMVNRTDEALAAAVDTEKSLIDGKDDASEAVTANASDETISEPVAEDVTNAAAEDATTETALADADADVDADPGLVVEVAEAGVEEVEPELSDEAKQARAERIAAFRARVAAKRLEKAEADKLEAQRLELRQKVKGTELSPAETVAAALRNRVHAK